MVPSSQSSELRAEVHTVRPIQRLLLIDVFRDKGSRLVFYWAAAFLALGTLVYHWLEGWSYLDSLYFCVISLATIGYGDLTPTTSAAKVFTILYVLNGIAILLAVFDRIRIVRNQIPIAPKGMGGRPLNDG
jgi:voltage-gated potassium channel